MKRLGNIPDTDTTKKLFYISKYLHAFGILSLFLREIWWDLWEYINATNRTK